MLKQSEVCIELTDSRRRLDKSNLVGMWKNFFGLQKSWGRVKEFE